MKYNVTRDGAAYAKGEYSNIGYYNNRYIK